MKTELDKVISKTAYALATGQFRPIREKLQAQARALLKEGKKPDEVARIIQSTGLPSDYRHDRT